ncbi:recombinase [Vibrio phage 2.095.A._10N.286.46.E10]|nr:recombinase [Vibrio phage 2.095.A._10N.286.46.E10]AUS02229.1 recombinase [Vibrio phage 2.095.B._10N.286.46.E10]
MNAIDELRERYGSVLMAFEKLVTSVDDLHEISGYTHNHFEQGGGALRFRITNCGRRSLPQNDYQHVLYSEISKYLVAKGRNEWTPGFVKKNLKNKFLGWQTETFVDVKTGERREIWTLKSSSKLDKGEAMNYITQILDWAESIGCHIRIPEDSEYMKLMQSQNM